MLGSDGFQKSWAEIAENASLHFQKASVPLKMYLKSLAILEKAFISLEMSSTCLLKAL
jgi:hypothetical protein